MDAAALTGSQHDQVEAERAHAQLGPQALEALVVAEVERREAGSGAAIKRRGPGSRRAR
jgi:hypothetical protein